MFARTPSDVVGQCLRFGSLVRFSQAVWSTRSLPPPPSLPPTPHTQPNTTAAPDEAITLTPAAVFFIAASFVDWLRAKGTQDVQVCALAGDAPGFACSSAGGQRHALP